MAGRQILRGTNAQRVALGGLSAGEFGFETDTKDLYVGAAGGDQLVSDASAWANLDGQDQAVKTTSSPTFLSANIGPQIRTATIIGKNAGNIGVATGAQIVCIGEDCGASLTTGWKSVYIGWRAGMNVTTSLQNTAVGWSALMNNVSGDNNTAFGTAALLDCSVGVNNVAVGLSALHNCQDGQSNTAIGTNSQLYGEHQLYNTSVGYNSMGAAIVAGQRNNAFGMNALKALTTGDFNNAFGYDCMNKATAASQNVSVGDVSMNELTTGTNNVAIGQTSLYSNQTGSGNVAIGYYAGAAEVGSDTFYVNNRDRGDIAAHRTLSLIYGTFAAASANQRFRINARLGVTHLPNYANNAAAAAGGLISGELYTVTGTDPLQVAAVI